ncbi:MAG: sensor histidine kinase [Phycisphaerales bacterium JB040]
MPARPASIPWTLAGAVGLVALVVVATIIPTHWRAPLAVGVVAWVLLMLQRDRAALARAGLARAHDEERDRLTRDRDGALEEARDFRAILDAVPTPILVVRPSGRVSTANPGAARLLSRRPGEIRGRELEDLLPQEELLALFDQARAGTPARARLRLVLKDRTRYFDVTARLTEAPATEDHTPVVVIGLEDVTTLAESVQLKSDFAANASHELRTPIAAIRGAVDTLAVAMDDREMVERLAAIIARHAVRLEEMVKDLLDLSRLESADSPSQAEPVDLDALVARLDAHAEGTRAERDVELRFELHEDLRRLYLEERLLELILRNLIENAGKFAHEHTTVRVVGEPADVAPAPQDPDAPAPINLDPSLPGVRFRVIDRGQGIPLKHQARVFERFFQVDPGRDARRQHRGTGLGLAIVKHAVRRLAGRVDIQSVLHEGTTVTVEIPHCIRPEEYAESRLPA